MTTDAQLIAAHRRINTALKAEEAAWDARRKELKTMLMSVEGVLNARIIALGADMTSIATEEGTAFVRTNTYVAVKDKEALKEYITKTQDYSFLDFDVTRRGVEAYIEAHGGHEPPGVKITKINQIIVRES